MTGSASTIVGLPPDAPSPAEGGRPASLDDARARKREQDRAAKARQRNREKQAREAAPADASEEAGEPAPIRVRFKDGETKPTEVLVDRATLEQLVQGATSAVASVTKDGRAFFLANLRVPGTGRTFAGDVGHHADVVLAMNGVALTPEATAYANLLASLGVAVAVVSALPKLDLEAAAAALPDVQRQVDMALGQLKGNSH